MMTKRSLSVIGWIVDRLASRLTARADVPDRVALQADYQLTLDVIKTLTDIRFRCLVFVTAVITLAVSFLKDTDPATRLVLGLVGFVATLGIAIYELRNSQLYEAAIHRAKVIEKRLAMVPTTRHSRRGGLFTERPPYVDGDYWRSVTGQGRPRPRTEDTRLMRFFFVKVKHDHGLALIYGGALAGWVYLVAYGTVSLAVYRKWLQDPATSSRSVAGLLGLLMFLATTASFVYHDAHRFRPEEPPDEA